MSTFWIIVGAAIGIGVLAYGVGKWFESFGRSLDAISSEASDEGRPAPPQSHRPIY